MGLLLDTHALVWLSSADRRLGRKLAAALEDPKSLPLVSVVTAWEYADLQARRRLPSSPDLESILTDYSLGVAELPPDIWRIAATLPPHHLDPIDRMLVAHAMIGGFTIATADRVIGKYPVSTLW